MPRTKISEFSSTPASNTDIDSINIAENCAPSGINDAIRELMAQLKDFQTGAVGDSFNGPVGTSTAAAGAFTTLAASGAVTLSGGTANGVAYLNGSKVVTSGSALTFDGTRLLVGTTTDIAGGGYFGAIQARGSYPAVVISGTEASAKTWQVGENAGSLTFYNTTDGELMRLTSTGLGIGTSSPSQKLDVRAAAGGIYLSSTTGTNQVALQTNNSGGDFYFGIDNSAGNNFNTGTAYAGVLWRSGANPICFVNNNTERMRLDSSGNLGLGVTPSAWATLRGLQVGNASLAGFQNFAYLNSNAFYDGSAWKYISNGFAGKYDQVNSAHAWYTAPSGTAGNAITFTQAMTLDASGRLGIGETSLSERLTVRADGASVYTTIQAKNTNSTATLNIGVGGGSVGNGSLQNNAYIMNAGNSSLVFGTNDSERCRIDSSGNLLVGGTSVVLSSKFLSQFNGNTHNGAILNETASTTSSTFLAFTLSGTAIGSVARVGATSAVVYNTTSDYRLKTVTGAVTGQGARLDALKPVDYVWTEGGQQARGFLAHEFQAVYSNSVTGTKDAVDANGNPKYQSMQAATSEVIADLVAELQSIRKRLADAGI